MIRFEHLTVGYGQRKLIADVDVSIKAGRLVALIGRNGAGKSSLLRVVAGIDAPQGGKVLIKGSDVAAMSPAEKARTVAFVTTQRVKVAHLRCRDVVALGRAPYTDWIGRLGEDDRKIVDRALERVGMASYADRTMDQMSDGECQRVMIARALAQDTPVLLLDEPTSFLDLPNRYDLCLLLSRLAHEEDKCVIFSTHELDIALTLCDDVALVDSPYLHLLSASEMAESGHIERLFSNPGITFDPKGRRVLVESL